MQHSESNTVTLTTEQFQHLLLMASKHADTTKMTYVFEDEETATRTEHQIDFRLDGNKIADSKGNTWLHVGAYSGSEKMIQGFLNFDKDLDLEPRNRDGDTPLMVAVKAQRQKIVQLLLDHKADSRAVNFGNGFNGFHYAVSVGCIPIAADFLDRGMDVNVTKHTSTSTALHIASELGDVNMVRFLLERSAKITESSVVLLERKELDQHIATESGFTPLFSAAKSGKATVELIDLLVKYGDDPYRVLDNGSNLLHWSNRTPPVCSHLLTWYILNPNQMTSNGLAPFHNVNDSDLMKCFLKRGAKADCPDPGSGYTLLCRYVSLISYNDWYMLILLLDHGADPNQKYEGRKVFTLLFDTIQRRGATCEINAEKLYCVVEKFIEKGGVIDYEAYKHFKACYLCDDKKLNEIIYKSYTSDCTIL